MTTTVNEWLAAQAARDLIEAMPQEARPAASVALSRDIASHGMAQAALRLIAAALHADMKSDARPRMDARPQAIMDALRARRRIEAAMRRLADLLGAPRADCSATTDHADTKVGG